MQCEGTGTDTAIISATQTWQLATIDCRGRVVSSNPITGRTRCESRPRHRPRSVTLERSFREARVERSRNVPGERTCESAEGVFDGDDGEHLDMRPSGRIQQREFDRSAL